MSISSSDCIVTSKRGNIAASLWQRIPIKITFSLYDQFPFGESRSDISSKLITKVDVFFPSSLLLLGYSRKQAFFVPCFSSFY